MRFDRHWFCTKCCICNISYEYCYGWNKSLLFTFKTFFEFFLFYVKIWTIAKITHMKTVFWHRWWTAACSLSKGEGREERGNKFCYLTVPTTPELQSITLHHSHFCKTIFSNWLTVQKGTKVITITVIYYFRKFSPGSKFSHIHLAYTILQI